MELKVYDGEYFERGNLWFIIFVLFIIFIIIISFLSSNILGAIIILFIAGGYLYFLTKINDVISLKIGKNSLQIGGKNTLAWNNLAGFVLEYDKEKKYINNIIIIPVNKQYLIYTIKDTTDNLDDFLNDLSGYIPMLDKYDQPFFNKLIRKLKL